MPYAKESDFEKDVIALLKDVGWEKDVLKWKSEKDLLSNWKDILFQNNRGIDRLNDYPLTDTEMGQIMEQIRALRTPLNLNTFINGKSVSIIRDNPDDKAHFGKQVSLKIYDRQEIAAGSSRYQIAEQPEFNIPNLIAHDRRGDLMLLINGMPVIHIELKKTNVPVSRAVNQIIEYSHEKVFTGLFSLIQVFVAMTPDETLYFANPGPDGVFNSGFFFHWENPNNVIENNWKDVVGNLLRIPMAHELIGFYTVPDDTDGILKVMRSYQCYAAREISRVVYGHRSRWDDNTQRGGYIWHTTGSGKTLTSFKSAQLIATSKLADKVVFLMDRIELGNQSLRDFRGFASDDQKIQGTENSYQLDNKLRSSSPSDTLIVTSIQKMSRLKEEGNFSNDELNVITSKRIVFIVDECHRSTFGDMLYDIKKTFKHALFFGFSGTPILPENAKDLSTTADIFGNELHRYIIADGIRDKNVLGFDPYMVSTYKDSDIRAAVALQQAKAKSIADAFSHPLSKRIYLTFMNPSKVPMAGFFEKGKYHKGIEDYVPETQFNSTIPGNERCEHPRFVVNDIINNWQIRSVDGKFHALFATNSIPEAINYYHLFKEANQDDLNVCVLFDPNDPDVDNPDKIMIKNEAMIEIIDDYNKKYKQSYSLATWADYKKDIALRLAHKKPYNLIGNDRNEVIDILIVVDQMLTGFDSKWINSLYLDKMLNSENIVQAFSRTNRPFGPEKPHGQVYWYRKVYSFKRDMEAAFELYSGNKAYGIFVSKLKDNLLNLNATFNSIDEVFTTSGISNFDRLPTEKAAIKQFVDLFRKLVSYLRSAKIQGFSWDKKKYHFEDDATGEITTVEIVFDEHTFSTLLQRYKELSHSGAKIDPDAPFDIVPDIVEIHTDPIDDSYMNMKFGKYLKYLQSDDPKDKEMVDAALNELSRSYSSLSQEDQSFAKAFINDVQLGRVLIEKGKTFLDYISQYKATAKDNQIRKFADAVCINEAKLRILMKASVTENNINEYGRLDDLRNEFDRVKAKPFLDKAYGKPIAPKDEWIKARSLISDFVIKGGFDI